MRRCLLKIYAREGVGHLWLVGPLAQALERRRQGQWHGAATVSAEPFEVLALAVLWEK